MCDSREILWKRAGKAVKARFPRFKSRKRGVGSFRLTGVIRIHDRHIQLPRLGVLRLKERGYLPVTGVHILSATVSAKAGRWFVSVPVEMEIPNPEPIEKPVAGVDTGDQPPGTSQRWHLFRKPKSLEEITRP